MSGPLASAQASTLTPPGYREFPIPTPDARPDVVVTGPDGDLWFTEYIASKGGPDHAGRRDHRVTHGRGLAVDEHGCGNACSPSPWSGGCKSRRQLMMAADSVTNVCGPKGAHGPERTAVRHGSEDGSVKFGGRQAPVRRPRARTADSAAEVAAPATSCSRRRGCGRDGPGAVDCQAVHPALLDGTRPVGTSVEATIRSTSKSTPRLVLPKFLSYAGSGGDAAGGIFLAGDLWGTRDPGARRLLLRFARSNSSCRRPSVVRCSTMLA